MGIKEYFGIKKSKPPIRYFNTRQEALYFKHGNDVIVYDSSIKKYYIKKIPH